MDPPASLSVSVQQHLHQFQVINRLINMSILANVFMLPSCPVCHGMQCFKLCDINEKRKVWQDLFVTQFTL